MTGAEQLRTDVLVAGAGPAGCAAALQCSRLGLQVVLADAAGRAGGLVAEARLVENIPLLEGPLPGRELATRLRNTMTGWSLSPIPAGITRISRKKNLFHSQADGSTVISMAVILATGTVPVEYSLAGDHPPLLRSFVDLPDELHGLALAVIGGGEAAFDYALHAAELGCDVEMLVRSDSHRAGGKLPAIATAHPNVRISYDTVPVAALTSTGGITLEVDSPSGRLTREYAAVLAAVGRESRLPEVPGRFAQLYPCSVETTLPGLYLAGDAALGGLGQAGSAMGQGLTAAEKAFGFIMEGKQWD